MDDIFYFFKLNSDIYSKVLGVKLARIRRITYLIKEFRE